MGLGAALAVSIGSGRAGGSQFASSAPSKSSTLPVVGIVAPPASGGALNGITAISNLADVVERVRPSVVAVNTVVTNRAGAPQGEGLGTGVVVDQQGHILTNYHVIDGANAVTVKFADGTVLAGKVIGSDPGNDLAVVSVNAPADALTPARFANSDTVRAGQGVFAIGNPFSLEFSVTSGIVSGTDRQSGGGITGRSIRGVIQTDAAVNPGNSGGPLFDADGNVIGINASIENPTGQRVFVGVGFAIPANIVQRYLPDMIAGKAITHSQLGIAGLTLNAINAKEAGVDSTKGVYITSVSSGSAADRAGLKAAGAATASGALPPGGDVVVSVDGKPMLTIEQLSRTIDGYNVGDTVHLSVVRGGRTLDLSATLQEWTGR
jgi:putative serine protease PepD